MSKLFPWMKRRKSLPELPLEPPITLGNRSNGEFFYEATPRDRTMRALILRAADEKARIAGLDRREFLASTMGMATSLAVVNLVNGCGDSEGSTGAATRGPDGSVTGRDGGGGAGGYYDVPKDAMVDCTISNELFEGDEFIMDLQTHHIEDEETWRKEHPGQSYGGEGFAYQFPTPDCGLSKAACIGPDQYVEQIFLKADTTVAVLSGFPSRICEDATMCDSLLSNEKMAATRDLVNGAANSQRMVQHCQVQPSDNWPLQEEMMVRIRETYGNHGWKCYPPAGGGWWLDDPKIAYPFIQKTIDLGQPLICVHKGFPLLGFSETHADPKDVGPAASHFPEATFVIYHSAVGAGVTTFVTEGPYDPEGKVDPNNPTRYPATEGVNRLVKTVEDHGLKGKNVYAELGSAWVLKMHSTNQASHMLGKLLKYIGEDHVLYGSECLWFGSPQEQIETLRTFQIAPELQDMYGYPALTKELKAKIFGLSAAKIYGIDPDAMRCKLDQSKLALMKRTLDGELGGRRWAFEPPLGPRTRREFLRLRRFRVENGIAG